VVEGAGNGVPVALEVVPWTSLFAYRSAALADVWFENPHLPAFDAQKYVHNFQPLASAHQSNALDRSNTLGRAIPSPGQKSTPESVSINSGIVFGVFGGTKTESIAPQELVVVSRSARLLHMDLNMDHAAAVGDILDLKRHRLETMYACRFELQQLSGELAARDIEHHEHGALLMQRHPAGHDFLKLAPGVINFVHTCVPGRGKPCIMVDDFRAMTVGRLLDIMGGTNTERGEEGEPQMLPVYVADDDQVKYAQDQFDTYRTGYSFPCLRALEKPFLSFKGGAFMAYPWNVLPECRDYQCLMPDAELVPQLGEGPRCVPRQFTTLKEKLNTNYGTLVVSVPQDIDLLLDMYCMPQLREAV